MDGFVDLQDAIKSESKSRLNRVEKLASFSALILLGAAVWLAWPTLAKLAAAGKVPAVAGSCQLGQAWPGLARLAKGQDRERAKTNVFHSLAWPALASLAKPGQGAR